MGVLMQAFYWDCPADTGQDGTWWQYVESRVPALHDVGFTALWLPPVHKAANLGGPSMGYDPYDYYDFGTRRNTFLTPVNATFDVADIRERKSVVKVGLNFRWGPGGAVVAKY